MNKMTLVVPAILTDDPIALETMVRQAETFIDYVQFDFMDGQFVPSRSVTGEQVAALPMNLSWEAHLMVLRPENYLPGFGKAGTRKVIFHYEATTKARAIISAARKLGLEVGLAINPDTAVATIRSLIPKVDSVLLLSVHPGFYGAKFIPEVLDKVTELHSLYPDLEVGLDGGVKESNIAQIARTGVNVIYVGSAIFLQPQPAASYRRLAAMATEGSRSG